MKTTESRTSYKYLNIYVAVFISFYLTQAVLLNRLIDIGGLYITGGTFIYFLSPLVLDVTAEVYGYRVARQMLWLGFGAIVFFAVVIGVGIIAPAPPFWKNIAASYYTALHSLTRSTVVGLVASMIGQFVNIYLISKWKILLAGRYFWLRSVGSSLIGDALTVTLAILGIFSGRVPAHALTSLLVPELIVMVVFSAIGAVPASILARITARSEGLNRFDVGVNFNPFKWRDNS
jgi:uncharacterized integral membrane protein (TIGR00697 family)